MLVIQNIYSLCTWGQCIFNQLFGLIQAKHQQLPGDKGCAPFVCYDSWPDRFLFFPGDIWLKLRERSIQNTRRHTDYQAHTHVKYAYTHSLTSTWESWYTNMTLYNTQEPKNIIICHLFWLCFLGEAVNKMFCSRMYFFMRLYIKLLSDWAQLELTVSVQRCPWTLIRSYKLSSTSSHHPCLWGGGRLKKIKVD